MSGDDKIVLDLNDSKSNQSNQSSTKMDDLKMAILKELNMDLEEKEEPPKASQPMSENKEAKQPIINLEEDIPKASKPMAESKEETQPASKNREEPPKASQPMSENKKVEKVTIPKTTKSTKQVTKSERIDDAKPAVDSIKLEVKEESSETAKISNMADNKSQVEENVKNSEKYQEFLKKYEQKKTKNERLIAKYDADLDFKLNRKVKKVHFPLSKKMKAFIGVFSFVVVAAIITLLAVGIGNNGTSASLQKIVLSQPEVSGVYQVSEVYVGDKLDFDNIYINCTYSDGSTKKVELSRDMLSTTSTKIDSNDKFIAAGNVEFVVSYQKQTARLNFQVKENSVENITLLLPPKGSNSYNFEVENSLIDMSNDVIVNAKYSNGQTVRISLSDCEYAVGQSETFAPIVNGYLNFTDLEPSTETLDSTYDVYISYQSKTATFKIKVAQIVEE